MYSRPQVQTKVARLAKEAAALEGIELRAYLSKIIPMGIEAFRKEQEEIEAFKQQRAAAQGEGKAIAS